MKNNKSFWGGVSQLLSLFILLNIDFINNVNAAAPEDEPLQQRRLAVLLEKAKGDPKKAFDSVSFELRMSFSLKEIPELTDDLMSVLTAYGHSLEPSDVLYKLGGYAHKVVKDRKEAYQPIVEKMKSWFQQNYTPEKISEKFSEAYYQALIKDCKGNQGYLEALQVTWPEFCNTSDAIKRFDQYKQEKEQDRQEKKRLKFKESQRVWDLYETLENRQYAQQIFEHYEKALEPFELLKVITGQTQYLAEFKVKNLDEFKKLALEKQDYFALKALSDPWGKESLTSYYFPLWQSEVEQAKQLFTQLEQQLVKEVTTNTGKAPSSFYFMYARQKFYSDHGVNSVAEIERKAFTDDLPIEDSGRFTLLESLSVHIGPVKSCMFPPQWEERAKEILTNAGYVEKGGTKGDACVRWVKKKGIMSQLLGTPHW